MVGTKNQHALAKGVRERGISKAGASGLGEACAGDGGGSDVVKERSARRGGARQGPSLFSVDPFGPADVVWVGVLRGGARQGLKAPGYSWWTRWVQLMLCGWACWRGGARQGLKAPGYSRWTRWVQQISRLRAENLEGGGVWIGQRSARHVSLQGLRRLGQQFPAISIVRSPSARRVPPCSARPAAFLALVNGRQGCLGEAQRA